jgi:hypothetical protein
MKSVEEFIQFSIVYSGRDKAEQELELEPEQEQEPGPEPEEGGRGRRRRKPFQPKILPSPIRYEKTMTPRPELYPKKAESELLLRGYCPLSRNYCAFLQLLA